MATHRAPTLGTLDQVGPRQNIEVFHDRGQRYWERLRQLGHRLTVLARQLLENGSSRRIRQSGKRAIEAFVLNVNHVVKYWRELRRCQGACSRNAERAVTSARRNASFAQV